MSDYEYPCDLDDDEWLAVADKENSNLNSSGQKPLSVENSLAHQAGLDLRNPNSPLRKPLTELSPAVEGRKRARSPSLEAPPSPKGKGKAKAIDAPVLVPDDVLAEVRTSLRWDDLCPSGWAGWSNDKRVSWMRSNCETNRNLAKLVLFGYYTKSGAQQPTYTDLGCVRLPLAPTKDNGYPQLSFKGANKFALVNEVTVWAGGDCKSRHKECKEPQCSHRCPCRNCARIGHIVIESAPDNNDRKGCPGWKPCKHDDKVIWMC